MDREELLAHVENQAWYHTIDLGEGVVTRGMFDHRPVLDKYELPADLSGKRVLDVGTFDGFFAFEFERRGAEVVGLEIPSVGKLDWPAPLTRNGTPQDRPIASGNFDIAREVLKSTVRREFVSVYDVTREALGQFDLIFIGSVLVHLRDPVGALQALLPLCKQDLLVCEVVDRRLNLLSRWVPLARLQATSPHMTWWVPNRRCLQDMLEAAGFVGVQHGPEFSVPFTKERGGLPHSILRARVP